MLRRAYGTPPARTVSGYFTALQRANFDVDVLLEPVPAGAMVPAALVLRGPQARGLSRLRRCAPPGVEPAEGLLLPERALLEAQLEQERQRLADDGPGRDAEVLHHLVAVELGAQGAQLLLGRQLGDARLELVHAPGEGLRLASRCAVVQSQRVSTFSSSSRSPASRT